MEYLIPVPGELVLKIFPGLSIYLQEINSGIIL